MLQVFAEQRIIFFNRFEQTQLTCDRKPPTGSDELRRNAKRIKRGGKTNGPRQPDRPHPAAVTEEADMLKPFPPRRDECCDFINYRSQLFDCRFPDFPKYIAKPADFFTVSFVYFHHFTFWRLLAYILQRFFHRFFRVIVTESRLDRISPDPGVL